MGFDPASLAIIGTIGSLAGAGVSAYGQYESGQAKAQADAYQAQVYLNNQKIAQQNENWAAATGAAQESAQAMKTRSGVASLIAKQAAGGVDVNTGSAKAVSDSAATLGELDLGTTESNTARRVYGYRVEEASDQAKAQLSKMEGEQAETAGDIGGASSLISGASSAFGKYASWQKSGGWGNTG